MMRRASRVLLGWWLWLGLGGLQVSAQITMTVTTERYRYICYEPITVTITLKNNSGHTLHFGNDPVEGGHMKFELRSLKNIPIPPLDASFNPAANLILSPGIVKALSLPLNNYFDVQAEDDYELVVRINHRRLGSDYLSKPIIIQVRHGVRVWENHVGVPSSPDNQVIPVRKCSLNIFHQEDGDLYYLQLEDNDSVYVVARLGPRVHGVKPRCDVDALSRIHTLIQTAPRLFQHRVFDHNGQLKLTSAYTISDTTPMLIRDPDIGRVMVSGGQPAMVGEDYNKTANQSLDLPNVTTEKINRELPHSAPVAKKKKK